MMFSYQNGSNPTVDYPRLLISDTQPEGHIFEDEEIAAAAAIQSATIQSSMFYSTGAGRALPSSPVSYLRVAALLLDSLAANKSRLASVQQLYDVKISAAAAAKELREQAKTYREVEDNSGAFVIIEQCNTSWAFQDRFYKTIQRQWGAS